jgi:hypothetical protein
MGLSAPTPRTGVGIKPGPGAIDVVFLDTPDLCIGHDELFVVGDIRVVVACNDTDRRVAEGLKWSGLGTVIEGTIDSRIRLHRDKGARRRSNIEQNTRDIRVTRGIERCCRIAARIGRVPVSQDEVIERRYHVAPCFAAIEREIVAAMIEPDAGVVLTGDQVVGIGRIDCKDLLSLPAQRAVLIHAGVGEITVGEDVRASFRGSFAVEVEDIRSSDARARTLSECAARSKDRVHDA